MKRISLLFLLLTCFLSISAQYYNPYNNSAYNMGYAMMCVENGKFSIVNGDYDEAFEKFEEAYSLDHWPAAECLGLCYELGIGVDRDTYMADQYYEEGANHGNIPCRQAITRINNYGHYTASQRDTWIRNFIVYHQAQRGYVSPGTGSYDSGSSNGSSGSGRTCISCSGTGICKTCGGQGWYYHETGYYTGNSHKTKTTCPVCRGTGKCGTCHGSGSIR